MPQYDWAKMSARERDDLVARKVFGFPAVWCIGEHWFIGDGMDTPLPCYTTDISAAWEVVEKLKLNFEMQGHPHTGYVFSFDKYHASAWTATEAICLAALRAKGVDV